MKLFSCLIACLGLAFLAGCATPEARIKKNPEIFAQLSPGDQELIRQGKVAVGFTKEMVKLALGEPDRVYTRTDATGSGETWSYTTYETEGGILLYRGYYHRYYRWGDPYFPYYTAYPGRREREVFRIVFDGDRISSIEQRQK
jgi:outer membrane protein assembly factor BamE (lipoprotein component of BamABCDE complex)